VTAFGWPGDVVSSANLVFLAGLLHFCQIPAMMVAPKMLKWKEDLSQLSPINQWIFRVIAGGIMLAVFGLGVVVVSAPNEIAEGGKLGMTLCAFLAVFWVYRAVIQIFLYSRIWPGGWLGRLSHYGLCALFLFQTGAYGIVFLEGFLK
jgi:hypothetical protein